MDGAAIESAPTRLLPRTTFFRACTPHRLRRFGRSALDGAHSGITGGRFNSPKSPPTLYLAGSQTVAAFEVEQSLILFALPLPEAPLVVAPVRVDGARVVDLTNGLVLANLQIAVPQLLIPSLRWMQQNRSGETSVAQALGDAFRARADIDGLLVPSWFTGALPDAAHWPTSHTRNLVLFLDPDAPATPRGQATLVPLDPDGILP